MLADDLVGALDPVHLARQSGLNPDPWQRDVLRSDQRQAILLAARQSGKSSVCAVLALHEAIYRAPALVLMLAPALRQSQELYRKVRDGLGALGVAAPPAKDESALRLELVNGSRIIALPGKEGTVRGFSGAALLLVDEASRVQDALYEAIRPMLAVSGGRIVLLSTPFGRRGFFFREWTEGGPEWLRVKVTADDCPRIGRDWLDAERAAIGDRAWRQEYWVEFVETDDAVFGWDDVQAALRPDVEPLLAGRIFG